jgi:peptidoglycan-associated lipoprotein
MRVSRLFLLISISAVLTSVGCATNETPAKSEASNQSTSASQAPDATSLDGDAPRKIHFEFNSSNLDDESRKIIETNSKYLAANSSVTVLIEGHADERGTRAYNLALGERRAKAVARILTVMGVSEKRIQVTSYGEEKPVAAGHDETSWATNRRAEIIYRTTTASVTQ